MRLLCEECGLVQVAEDQPRPRRCLGCDRVYRTAFRVEPKPLSYSRQRGERPIWSEVENEVLRAAAQERCSYAEATVRVNAVPNTPERSQNAVRAHAHEYGIKGLRMIRHRNKGMRYWTEERLAPVHAAVRELGPLRAARHLKLSPNVVAGVMYRYPLPAQDD